MIKIFNLKGFDFMKCIKRDNAIAMFYAGESKRLIRETLKVHTKRLKRWINEDRKTAKEQVIHMFFFGYSKERICQVYNLSKQTFDMWLFEAFDDIKSHLEEKPRTTQPGRTQWTSKIIKQSVKN